MLKQCLHGGSPGNQLNLLKSYIFFYYLQFYMLTMSFWPRQRLVLKLLSYKRLTGVRWFSRQITPSLIPSSRLLAPSVGEIGVQEEGRGGDVGHNAATKVQEDEYYEVYQARLAAMHTHIPEHKARRSQPRLPVYGTAEVI